MSNTSRRCIVALAACLALMALAVPAALAVPPTGDFSVSAPASGRAEIGQAVQIPVADIVWGGATPGGTVTWNFGDGTSTSAPTPGATASTTHAYAAAGTYDVRVTLVNADATDNTTTLAPKSVRVNAPPVAVIGGFLPIAPIPGVDVFFVSGSFDPDGDTVTHRWNFGDSNTSPARNPVHVFASAGARKITLTVTDPPFGGSDSASADMGVVAAQVPEGPAPKPPIANFAFGPRSPQVGDQVDFVSTAVDPDSQLRTFAWDLDGDGQFDDARGAEVVHTYLSSGSRRVRLRVEDVSGLAAVHERTVDVGTATKPPPGFLRPAPHVRFNGLILERGTRIRILSVRAPRGSLVAVRCKARGKRCPAKLRRKRVRKGSVRFKTYERFLPAGTRLDVYVRKTSTIGAFTRYKLRAGKGPVRIDRCLPAGSRTKPRRRCG